MSPVGGSRHRNFYKHGGGVVAPKALLLHGFPSGGYMVRNLIPQLKEQFHVTALDLPGFSQSDTPKRQVPDIYWRACCAARLDWAR